MELLKKLTQISGASGNENKIRDEITNIAQGKCDEITVDKLGNLILFKKGNSPDKKKLMVAAHMDEIGIIVKYIDEKGFIRFEAIGGLYTKQLVGRRVIFENGTVGVIGCEEEAFNEKAKLNKLYIDIGAGDKTKDIINIGDMAVFEGDMITQGDAVISKALDNRAGCYVLLKALDKLNGKNDIYLTFTVQEEVGIRGAGAVTYAIEPDFAIAVDVTDTGDTPDAPVMDVKMGKGAAVKIMDSSVLCDAYLRSFIMDTAKKHNIPYQAEIMADGGTDAGKIHLTKGGVKTGGISIPTRYIHSPSEMASISDINACIDLLAAVLNEI